MTTAREEGNKDVVGSHGEAPSSLWLLIIAKKRRTKSTDLVRPALNVTLGRPNAGWQILPGYKQRYLTGGTHNTANRSTNPIKFADAANNLL